MRKPCLNKNWISCLSFFVHMLQFYFFKLLLWFLWSDCFLNGFATPFIVHSWSIYFSLDKENVQSSELFQGLSCHVFTTRRGVLVGCLFWWMILFILSTGFLLRPYDVTTTSNLLFCSFVHAISTELRSWRHFPLVVESVLFFICVVKFLVTRDLPHSQKWLSYSDINIFFTLVQRYKLKWVHVTLIERYLRATNISKSVEQTIIQNIFKSNEMLFGFGYQIPGYFNLPSRWKVTVESKISEPSMLRGTFCDSLISW